MAIIIGRSYPFGNCSAMPLRGFPEGRARIRMRSNEFAIIRIKTADGIREFHPIEKNGFWEPGIEIARNQTL